MQSLQEYIKENIQVDLIDLQRLMEHAHSCITLPPGGSLTAKTISLALPKQNNNLQKRGYDKSLTYPLCIVSP
jgi:hypothetical protein